MTLKPISFRLSAQNHKDFNLFLSRHPKVTQTDLLNAVLQKFFDKPEAKQEKLLKKYKLSTVEES